MAEIKIIKKKERILRVPPENYEERDYRHFRGDFDLILKEINLLKILNASVVQLFLFHRLKLHVSYCLTRQISFLAYIKAFTKLLIYPRRHVSRGAWVLDNWSSGYYHWITDVLPRILFVDEINEKYPLLIPEQILSLSYIKESLGLFRKEYIVYNMRECLKVKELVAPSHLQPAQVDPGYIKAVRSRFRFHDNFSFNPSRKIYISRKNARKRRVLNEKLLGELLLKHGFEIIEMEKISFYEQRKLMSQTKLLISNHGAGLTNMIFMPDNTSVIELKAEAEDTNNCYFNLARALDLKYYYTINKADNKDIQDANINVDMYQLQGLISNSEVI